MALDTQPLSAGRRGLMLGVLVVFLLGSLGFAEWLVVRKRVKPILTVDLGRYGFHGAVGEEFTDEVQGRMGIVEGRQRRVDVFAFGVGATGGGSGDIEAEAEGAKELFTAIMGGPAEDLKPGNLGGKSGVEATGVAEDGRFAWVRLAVSEGRAGAICYSGVGTITDADRKVFEEMCASGVKFGDSGR